MKDNIYFFLFFLMDMDTYLNDFIPKSIKNKQNNVNFPPSQTLNTGSTSLDSSTRTDVMEAD